MKKINVFLMSGLALMAIIIFSAFANRNSVEVGYEKVVKKLESISDDQQMVNLFVTHGHCSSPFTGRVENLAIIKSRTDAGNPLEDMQISFEIDPETFTTCRPEYQQITTGVRTPGVFISDKKDNIKFKSTSVYTMGMDWYQVNGTLSIKDVDSDVKFFVSGIREPHENMASKLVLEGQIDLSDWGIDYDLLVNGVSSEHPTKWMHLNMKIDLLEDC